MEPRPESLARQIGREGKKAFVLRLIPPRPTFAMDMNEHERRAMIEHVGYEVLPMPQLVLGRG